MQKSHVVTSFLAALIFSLAPLCAQAEKTQIALNWKAEPEFGGFYAADVGGAFKGRGLDVEILQGGAGTPVVQMIASGKVDFGIVSADEVVIARSHGADVVALFAAYQTNPQGVMVHAESGLQSMAEVFRSPGTLALQKGLPYAQFLIKSFNKNNEMKAKIVPYTGGIANFLADKSFSQQCFVTSEPLEASKSQKVKTFLVADVGYNPYTSVLATRGDLLKKNPQLVKQLVSAVRLGWEQYIKDPGPANTVMAKLNKSMDAEMFAAIAKAQLPLLESGDTKAHGVGHMTVERWKTLSAQLLDIQAIKTTPEPNSLFNNL